MLRSDLSQSFVKVADEIAVIPPGFFRFLDRHAIATLAEMSDIVCVRFIHENHNHAVLLIRMLHKYQPNM